MKTFLKTFVSAILAGFCIGLGGTAFIKLKDAFPGGNVTGAALFCIGLFCVITRGYSLYTGAACYLFDGLKFKNIASLLTIWVGNFVGCIAIALIVRESNVDIISSAENLVSGKMEASYLMLFCSAILCNICIYIAVDGMRRFKTTLGKYLALVLGVMVFVVCGMEHSVADMYFLAVSGTVFESAKESIIMLLVVSAGNLVGGSGFRFAEKLM